MKTIYLHIGTAKTATTSIQKTLDNFDNKMLLKKNGIHPITSPYPAYKLFEYLIYKVNREIFEELRKVLWHRNILSEHELAHIEKNFELEMKSCTCDKIIISCEQFSQYFEADDLEKLKIYLSSFFNEEVKFKIIVFFRNPVKYTQSLIQLLFKYQTENLGEDPRVNIPAKHLSHHYLTCLKRFETVFGKDALIVGNFDEALSQKNSIMGAFFSKLNFYDIDNIKVFFENESVSQLCFDVNFYINSKEPVILSDGSLNNRRYFGDLDGFDKAKGEKFRLNYRLCLEIIEAYKEDVSYLEENYNIKFEYKLNENDDAKFEFTDELIKSFERGYYKAAYILRPMLLNYIGEKIELSNSKVEKERLILLKQKLSQGEY